VEGVFRIGLGSISTCPNTGTALPARNAMDEPANQMILKTDDHLALMLMTMWALSTGRAIPEAPPDDMTVQQLIDFWGE
jgi:hypothetical protein